jgi:hypothetical protein
MNTKECRHCKQPIHAEARICQHCKSNQGWFANQTDPRFTVVILAVILAILVPLFIWLPDLILSSSDPKGRPNLVVAGTSVSYAGTPDGTRVLALGQVKNESQVEASRIWLRLELFDASDRVLDTILQEQSGLIVPRSGTKPFRIMALTTVSPRDIKRAAVTVERLRERGKYD